MKISTAALSFLILAAALGSLTHGSDVEVYEPRAPAGPHRPADCCFSYAQKIGCIFIKDYFETTNACSQPGVIFVTKKGRRVCANPSDRDVQECIMKLKLKPRIRQKYLFEEKEY